MKRALVAAYLRRHGGRYGAGILLLLATNALALSIPWMLKQAVEAIGRHEPMAIVTAWSAAILVVAALGAAVRTGSRLLVLGTARLVSYDLRRRLFSALLALPPSWYDRARTGDLMSRAVNDIQLVRSLFGPGVMNIVNTAAAYVGSVAIMAWIDPRLTLVSLIPYPFVFLAMNRLTRALYHRSNAAQEQLAALSSRAQENLAGMQQVKAFVREDAEIVEFAALAAEYRLRNLALARIRGGMVPLMGLIGGVGTLAVLWLGGRHVATGQMTLGDFVAFNAYLAGLAWPTLAMGWILNVYQRGMSGMERIGEILEAADRGVPEGVSPGSEPGRPGPPSLEFRHITFRYDASGAPALADVSFTVPAGTTVGIVGPVGSGKSTLLSLVAGLYPPPPGALFLNGRDLLAIPADEVRAQVGLVPQESFLFSRTIAENIAFGKAEASREAIERAADLAELSQDRADFPDGYDSVVGERGITLSGGQRQRTALARALLLDPPLLLLDDTLSAVDARVEAAILANMRTILRGRTCLIAASRMSAVSGADRVIVLDGGRIVESGPPAELAAAGGLYARLNRRQQLEDEMEKA